MYNHTYASGSGGPFKYFLHFFHAPDLLYRFQTPPSKKLKPEHVQPDAEGGMGAHAINPTLHDVS
jgi:hypothetical protein